MLIGFGPVRHSSMLNVENTVFRGEVRALAVANVDISTLNNGDSLDELTLSTDDLVLLTGQTDASENGVYKIAAAEGSTARWSEFNTTATVTLASVLLIGQGKVYAESLWMLTTPGTITIDTTDLTFFRLDDMRAESTVPTEVADGARVRPSPDTFGRIAPKGFDLSQNAQRVTEVAPALLMAPITGFTQLTAPGSTTETSADNFHHATYQVVVAAINTNVIVMGEGSLDGTNWFPLAPKDNTVSGVTYSGAQATITANGTYALLFENTKAKYIRFTWVSESGGTAATLDVDDMKGN